MLARHVEHETGEARVTYKRNGFGVEKAGISMVSVRRNVQIHVRGPYKKTRIIVKSKTHSSCFSNRTSLTENVMFVCD